MDVEENVEDFLARVKELDNQRQREDELRRRQLEDDIQSYKSRDIYNISIPKPVAREESTIQSRSRIPHSDSLQNFNNSVSRQYRLDIDDLVYESAYNYEKSQRKPGTGNVNPSLSYSSNSIGGVSLRDKDVDDSAFRATTGGISRGLAYEANDVFSKSTGDEPFRASIGTVNREKSYKKYDNIPDIIRFDDMIHKPSPNFKSSRYSKFQLTEDQKRSIDSTIEGLIGNGGDGVTNDNQEDKIIPKPLVRERKGGLLPSLSPSAKATTPELSSNSWGMAAKGKPALAPPSSLSQLKRSPRKTELTSPTKAEEVLTSPVRADNITSPMKKSPAKIDFSRYTSKSQNENTPPPIAPKPLGFQSAASKRHTWMGSAVGKTSSTPQWQDTSANYQVNKSDAKKPSWLESASSKSSSTPQWQDTTSKFHVDSSEDKQASWLNSAMKNTTHREFEIPKSKIKPIVPSKSNTLQEKLKKEEEFKERQHSTLKELETQKLNHINNPIKFTPKLQPEELSYSTTILKKTRSSSPTRNDKGTIDEPEFLKQRLSPASKATELHSSSRSPGPESPEAISQKSSLKPPLPKRKPSLKVPEALQKAEKLKPALPARKPSIEVPEALKKIGNLRQAEKQEQREEPTPEAMSRKSQLKPAVPQRKLSQKEVEALAQLNRIKSKKGPTPPETKPKPRVFSNSKELLQNQLGSLKATKALPKEEASLNLEKVLQRAQTDSELKPVRLPFMAQTDEMPVNKIKKASTFDTAELNKGVSTESLEHLTKKRAKGPKRRTKKNV